MEKLVLIIEITENKKLFSITNRFSLPVPKNGSQNAQFDYPLDTLVVGNTLYVADKMNDSIRAIDLD